MLDNVDGVVYFAVQTPKLGFSIFDLPIWYFIHVIFVYEIRFVRSRISIDIFFLSFFFLVFVSLFFLLFLVGASLLHSINSAFSETFLLLFSYINVTTHLPYSRSFQFIFNTIQQHHWRSFNGWCIHNEVMHLEHSNVLCRYSPFHHAAHIYLWAL